MAKNAPKVPFPMSTREQCQKANDTVASTPLAGPGAYDVIRGMKTLSTTHKIISDGSFTRASRASGNDVVRLMTDAGPGEYQSEGALDYVKPRAAVVPFGMAPRDEKAANANFPGPSVVTHIDKHSPRACFPTGPGHIMGPADPVTAAVPFRDAQRSLKHKPKFKFSTAPRW